MFDLVELVALLWAHRAREFGEFVIFLGLVEGQGPDFAAEAGQAVEGGGGGLFCWWGGE